MKTYKCLAWSMDRISLSRLFEALALIVALKTWSHHWQNSRVCLIVRTDSVSGLTVMMKHKSSGEAPALIAREAALLISRSTYTPTIYEHIPGIANVIADALSRIEAPGSEGRKKLPAILDNAKKIQCPPRPRGWWRALSQP